MRSEDSPLVATATATAHVRVQAPSAQQGKESSQTPKRMLIYRLDGWYWQVVLASSMLLTLCTQLVMHRGGSTAGGGQGLQIPPQQELTLLEQQLYGCRTFKSQAIPHVDTNASLRVLDTYTPEQRQQAQRFTEAVSACTDFACLREANKLPRAPGQFRFPHFMVLGFPKCATTSIYCHLIRHPQVQYAKNKESHLLSDQCDHQLSTCSPEKQREYVDVLSMQEITQAQFTRAAFDGSTHYAAEGDWLAEQLAATFPWVKVVISMRDPISQALAMLLHNFSHNRTAECWDNNGQRAYTCVLEALEDNRRARYGPKVEKWMEFFPPERLRILQYEGIISKATMRAELQGLKAFLEIEEHLPSDKLPLTNWKHMRGDDNAVGRYWNMTRSEYEHLVEVARRNSYEVIKLMGQNGHADKDGKIAWARNWELVWRNNLNNNCEDGPEGNCKIVVS